MLGTLPHAASFGQNRTQFHFQITRRPCFLPRSNANSIRRCRWNEGRACKRKGFGAFANNQQTPSAKTSNYQSGIGCNQCTGRDRIERKGDRQRRKQRRGAKFGGVKSWRMTGVESVTHHVLYIKHHAPPESSHTAASSTHRVTMTLLLPPPPMHAPAVINEDGRLLSSSTSISELPGVMMTCLTTITE